MRGQRESGRIAGRRDALDRRAARILEAEQAGDLVERLAGGVVAGGGEPLGDAVLAEHDALGVAAADQQRQVRRLELGCRRATRCTRGRRGARRRRSAAPRASAALVAYMVPTIRQPARPGSPRDRDGIDGVPAAGHGSERGVDHGGESLEMGASRQLGNDTAVDGVQGDLRRHHRGTDLAAVGEHRRRGLVAGGLDREEIQADGYSIEGPPPTPATSRPLRIAVNPRLNSGAWMLSLHMITASSPLSV